MTTTTLPPTDVNVEEDESNLGPAIEEPVEAVSPPLLRMRRVNFGPANVQEYKLTLGDHPCCPGSYPLTLDWPRTAVKKYGVNEYDDAKQRKGPWCQYTEEGRLSVLEDVTGVDRSVGLGAARRPTAPGNRAAAAP